MENTINNEHDKSYKIFLEDRHTFLEFLKGFVYEEWIDKIKEEDLILVNNSFILKDYKGKEADIIYKAKIDGKEVYLYILFEMQSTVDYTIPYRLLVYMAEIWRRHFENEDEKLRERKAFRLPAIIPMVLYNGKRRWTAVRSFAEYQNGMEYFKEHLVDFKYILFSAREYDEEDLRNIGSLMAKIFLFERGLEAQEKFSESFAKSLGSTDGLTNDQWIRFKRWIKLIMLPKIAEENRDNIIDMIEKAKPMEVKKLVTILEQALDQRERKARVKGIQEGIQKGIQEGIQKGILVAAKNLLQKGKSLEEVIELLDLPEEVVEKLK